MQFSQCTSIAVITQKALNIAQHSTLYACACVGFFYEVQIFAKFANRCYAYWESAETVWQSFDCFNWQYSFESGQALRYLGVLIDSTLLASVASRVRSRISSMLRFGTLPPTVLCLLYPPLSCLCLIIVMWFGLLLLLN